MKPFFIPLIPALACGLQPASGKFDQILLQGKNPKGVQHRVVVILTIVSLRMDKELAVSFKKPARDTIGREGNSAKVTEHGAVRGVGHGAIVIGELPVFCLLGMA